MERSAAFEDRLAEGWVSPIVLLLSDQPREVLLALREEPAHLLKRIDEALALQEELHG